MLIASIALWITLALSWPAWGQASPTDIPSTSAQIEATIQQHGSTTQAEEAWLAASALPDESPVPKFKNRALQKVSVAGGWMGATNQKDLSSSFASASFTIGIPLGSLDHLLAITPGYRTDWNNPNDQIEIPGALHDLGIDLFHTRKLNDRWKTIAMVRPSYRSDLTTSREAIKVFGLGLAVWEFQPQRLSISFGAVYLGRSDIATLPAVGLTWTPDTRNRIELQFPRSRWLHRHRKDGSRSELWSYATAGIGGNTWAVTRRDGRKDEIAMRDLRLTFGLEKTVAGGGGWFAETGLALDRSIEYLSDDSEQTLSNGIIASLGWIF